MIRLSKQDTKALVAVLRENEQHARERAVYDAFRAQAMKSIGERLLVKAHQGYAHSAIASADRAVEWIERLETAMTTSITSSARLEIEGRER